MINFMVDVCDTETGLGLIVQLVHSVVDLIKWGVPILLIIFGMLDLGKAVMAGKEDEMKKAQGTLIKRFIYAVAVFVVVNLVTFAMNLVPNGNDWIRCWQGVNGNISTGGNGEG